MKTIIFRDDDIAVNTRGVKFEEFKQVQSLFDLYNVPHTIAIICRDIEKNVELIDFINSNPLIVPQFHCMDHIMFTESHHTVTSQFTDGIRIFKDLFGKKPSLFFPPWNMTDAFVTQTAKQFGMETSVKKVSLGQYIRVEGSIEEDVINFHYWSLKDRNQLGDALKIYTGK